MTKRAFVTRNFEARHALLSLLLITIAAALGCQSAVQSVAPATNRIPNGPVRITLSPPNPSIASGASLQFIALVQDARRTSVQWSASTGTISPNGLFSAPSTTSPQTVTIVATSADDPDAHAATTVTIIGSQGLSIATGSLPSATSGSAYSATLAANGGKPPYQWTIASGALPTGLQLGSTGALSGTPSKTGTFSFTVGVSDAAANKASQAFSVVVASGSSGGGGGGNAFDGPAELPRVYLQSTLADTPAPGKTTSLKAGGNFQSALDNATCGDTIQLQAGASFPGVFYFPQKSCDDNHWIVVRTSAPDTALPAEGTRITPCYAGVNSLPGRPGFNCTSVKNVMAQLVFNKNTGFGPVIFSSGANHYRLIGLEVTRTAATSIVSELITPDASVGADHIVLDRLWVHGTPQDETTRGVYLSGVTSVAVVDSFFTDFHCIAKTGACVDSQAISGAGGDLPMGPFKIVNNFLEAAGENILLGGSAATMTPTDIEIRQNHFYKPMIWMLGQHGWVGGADGNPFVVKNHFEVKNAQRILFEGNILENNWGGLGQNGYSVILSPKNQTSNGVNICPICQVTDVTIRYITISHVGGGFILANAKSDAGGLPLDGQRYSIHDVVVDDISDVTYQGRGTFAQVSTVPAPILQNIRMDHITAFQPHVLFNVGADESKKMLTFMFTNSIVNAGEYPFSSTGGTTNCAFHTDPQVLLDACFSPYAFSHNAIIALPKANPASQWPAGNFFPTDSSAVQFVNYHDGNGGDYHLQSTSPYKNAGTDGRDLGADITAILSKTAGVR